MQEEEPQMKGSDSDDDGSLASELAEEEIFSRPQAGQKRSYNQTNQHNNGGGNGMGNN